MKIRAIITGAVAIAALAIPATAQAGTAPVMVQTPGGFLPAVPSTVIPTNEISLSLGLVDPTQMGEFLTLGTPQGTPPVAFGWNWIVNDTGIVLSGSIDPSIEQPSCSYDFSSPPGFAINLIDQTGRRLGMACVPMGTTSLNGVIVWSSATCFTSNNQCSLAQMMPTSVEIGVPLNRGYVNLGTFTIAAYSPIASITGDPWLHFRSAFRAKTYLVIRGPHGNVVRNRDLGVLGAGAHSVHFRRGTLRRRVTYRVWVHGRATDGAVQNSPTRTVGFRR